MLVPTRGFSPLLKPWAQPRPVGLSVCADPTCAAGGAYGSSLRLLAELQLVCSEQTSPHSLKGNLRRGSPTLALASLRQAGLTTSSGSADRESGM